MVLGTAETRHFLIMPGQTNLSNPQLGEPQMYKTHEGEHHGDFSGSGSSGIQVTKKVKIFVACAALNSCNLGFDVGVSSNAGPLLQRDLGLTNVQRELFVGSLNLWSIFGSLFAHWICDKFGRRYSFVAAAVSFIVGVVIMAMAPGYEVLMIGRLFVGLGVGFGLAIDPLYIAEVSPAAHRGELVTMSEIALNVGIVLGFLTGFLFYDMDDSTQWRLMFICGAFLPMIVIILARKVMPESPRWLVANGRDNEAEVVLKQVYPEGFDVQPVIVDIKEAIERERIAEGFGWHMILFPTPAIRRMLIAGIGVAIAQQAVGIDAIQYYLIDVLEESGIENEKTRISILILLGLLKLIFIVVGGKLFDRRGRRPLLFASLAGITVALLLCSFTFMANGGDVSRVPVGFTIFGLALYMSFFSIGVGPGCWLIPSEIFATSIRAKAMSLAAFFNRITATLMSSTFLSTSNAITTGGFFIMLAVICVISIIFIYFYLPETKGRSLEDMSVYFAEVTNDQTLLDAEAKIVQEREAAGGSVEMGSSNKTGTMT